MATAFSQLQCVRTIRNPRTLQNPLYYESLPTRLEFRYEVIFWSDHFVKILDISSQKDLNAT